MKKIIFSAILLVSFSVNAQKIYDPNANAERDIAAAVKKAKAEGKHVLIQAGGNWCKWCLEFARFAKAEQQVDSIIQSSYVWYHLNWSRENENPEIFKKYGYPQRFGFPVFIILDENGNRIHTQSSEYLEDGGKSYQVKKVADFLLNWTPAVLRDELYRK